MSMLPNNAVLGEAGSTQFNHTNTFVGSNPVTMNFNVFQQLKIDTNFFNSEYVEHYMIGATEDNSNKISEGYMQFNTKGWVRADAICLTVPITFKYNWRNAMNQDPTNTDLHKYWANVIDFKIGGQGSNPCLCFTKERLKYAWHPRFAVLDIFNKIDIKIGNNFQPVQKTFETTPLGLKHVMSTHRFGYNVAKVMSYWGLPFSTFGTQWLKSQGNEIEYRTQNDPTAIALASYIAPRKLEYNEEITPDSVYSVSENSFWIENYCDFLRNVSFHDATRREYQNRTYKPVIQRDFNNINISLPRFAYEYTYERELTLPLQCITSFFREARYLPPDFRMHLSFEKSNFDPLICVSSAINEFPGVYENMLPGLEQTTDFRNGLVTQPTLPSEPASWYKRFYSLGSDTFGLAPVAANEDWDKSDPNNWPRVEYALNVETTTPTGDFQQTTNTRTRLCYNFAKTNNIYSAPADKWHFPLAPYATCPTLNEFNQNDNIPHYMAMLIKNANNVTGNLTNTQSAILLSGLTSQSLNTGAALANNLKSCAFESDSKHFLRDFYIRASVNLSKIRLTYNWNVLKQELQASIATSWLSKPFLYNYESSEMHEIPVLVGQSNILANIAINSQRPTTLYFMLLASQNMNWPSTDADFNNDSTIMSRLLQYDVNRSFVLTKDFNLNGLEQTTMTSAQAVELYGGVGSYGRPQYNNFKAAGTEGILKINEPCTLYRVNNAADARSLTKDDMTPIQWQNFEIRFSGRTALRFRNDKLINNHLAQTTLTAYDFITNLEHENSFTKYCSEHVLLNTDTIDAAAFGFNNVTNPFLLKCIINPGGLAERGVISALQGSVNIQINIDFTAPLMEQYKIGVIRTNPEQFVFDSDKNASIVQWPAIKNRLGYLLPNITLAP